MVALSIGVIRGEATLGQIQETAIRLLTGPQSVTKPTNRQVFGCSTPVVTMIPLGGGIPVKSWFRQIQKHYISIRFGSVDPNAELGVRGEQAAAIFLRRKGLFIISRREHDRLGEIDLIAVDRKRKTVVFIEVKTLSTSKPGHPADRVDQAKQARITRAAMRYLKRKNLLGIASRFDVVAIWWPTGRSTPERIEHYQSAFEAHGRYQLYA